MLTWNRSTWDKNDLLVVNDHNKQLSLVGNARRWRSDAKDWLDEDGYIQSGEKPGQE